MLCMLSTPGMPWFTMALGSQCTMAHRPIQAPPYHPTVQGTCQLNPPKSIMISQFDHCGIDAYMRNMLMTTSGCASCRLGRCDAAEHMQWQPPASCWIHEHLSRQGPRQDKTCKICLDLPTNRSSYTDHSHSDKTPFDQQGQRPRQHALLVAVTLSWSCGPALYCQCHTLGASARCTQYY